MLMLDQPLKPIEAGVVLPFGDPFPRMLLACDVFTLHGPDGELLQCQWTSVKRQPGVNEFEIIVAEDDDRAGCLFGLYDSKQDIFALLPAADHLTGRLRTDIKVDVQWRGTRHDICEIGTGWYWDAPKSRFLLHPHAA